MKLKNYISAILDIFIATISFPLALYLRLGDETLAFSKDYLIPATIIFIIIFTVIAQITQIHKLIWRYISVYELVKIVKLALISIILFYLVFFILTRLENIPRSVPILHILLLVSMLVTPRFIYRYLKQNEIEMGGYNESINVLLIGYRGNAEQFLRISKQNSTYNVLGLIDNDKTQIGRIVHGVKILGTVEDINIILSKFILNKPQKIIVSEDYIASDIVMKLLDICQNEGMTLSRIPRLMDFTDGEKSLRLRPINVEDLLGRPQNIRNKEEMQKFINGKSILITGAGGSIGSELSRQIANFSPNKIILLDICEYNLYKIDLELQEKLPSLQVIPIIADVRNASHIGNIFNKYKPNIIFHAAANKHVPLSEINISETILTNVFGTLNIASAANANGAENMVMISTDKAVNPTNIMGATKRIAENICSSFNKLSTNILPFTNNMNFCTNFCTVRFGNVLGSTGSVVPLFKEQLEQGRAITVTHPDMVRYFMTIREAVELVITASSSSKNTGSVFVLDMGTAIKIKELAQQMIRLTGLKIGVDAHIKYTGLRAGEKLYEELFYEGENLSATENKGINIAKFTESTDMSEDLKKLYKLCIIRDDVKIKHILQEILPEYNSN